MLKGLTSYVLRNCDVIKPDLCWHPKVDRREAKCSVTSGVYIEWLLNLTHSCAYWIIVNPQILVDVDEQAWLHPPTLAA